MNIKVEELSSIKKKLFVDVPVETVDAEFGKAYKNLAKTAKVPGFRSGKVPRAILEKHYGPRMQNEILERLINDTYFKALAEHKILAVSNPEIVESSSLEQGQPFSYEAQVEVRPDVQVKDYLGLELKKELAAGGDEAVTERLDELRKSAGKLQVCERELCQTGDLVVIDFEGFIDGQAFERGSAEDHQLELGSGTFIPGFEDKVVGMRRGEQRAIDVTFPSDYGNKELAGKPAVFQVTLKEIKERVLPELNDDFAKEMGLVTLDDLKEKIRESHVAQENDRIEKDFRDRLIDALVERNPFELPESMVETQLEHMLENLQQRMQSQGMSLKDMGLDPASFRKIYRDIAVKQVKGSLLLEAIALQENLKVDEDEIREKLDEIVQQTGAPKEVVMNFYADESRRRALVSQLAEEKVIYFLTGKANIQVVAKDQL